MPISPEHRRFQQMYYLDSSERDAGVSHLWHMHRLAEARLRPGKGILDAPDVDFRHPEQMDVKQMKASALMTRLQRRIMDEEQHIVKGNETLYRHLLNVNDNAYRESRGMNTFPSKEELKKWYRKDQHALALLRGRSIQEAKTRKDNRIIMEHLVNTKPLVTSAKDLAKWYYHDHRKQIRQLSRFKRSEPFAGASILTKECNIRLVGSGRNGSAPLTSARDPLLWRQHKTSTLMETLQSGPLIPSLQEASESYLKGNVASDADFDSTGALSAPRRKKKAQWKGISALDITLMNYASDLRLVRGGESAKVRREEENAITRLWRESIDKKYRARERSVNTGRERDLAVPVATGTATTTTTTAAVTMDTEGGRDEACLKSGRKLSTTIMWSPNRWKSRTSILTLLGSRPLEEHRRRSMISLNDHSNAASPKDGATGEFPKRGSSASIKKSGLVWRSFDGVSEESAQVPLQVDENRDHSSCAENNRLNDEQSASLGGPVDESSSECGSGFKDWMDEMRRSKKPFASY